MSRPEYLKEAQRMLESHQWGHYVEGDPNRRTMGQGGKGTIAVGCEKCKIPLNTIPQFMEHLANDVPPEIVDMVIERSAISET